jgi:hypothetical protein
MTNIASECTKQDGTTSVSRNIELFTSKLCGESFTIE